MYFLLVILFTGLAESHPNLVGASKRLVSAGICGMITEGLRLNCKVTGSRKWSHLNFPFTCRICLQTCQCVFSFAGEHSGADALRKFTKCGFQGILLKPPTLVSDDLAIEDIQGIFTVVEGDEIVGDEWKPKELKTAMDIQMTILFEEGKFNGNVEYLVNVEIEKKHKIMTSLFKLFHIE